jgi:V8-like Glu-specific endopeptidase
MKLKLLVVTLIAISASYSVLANQSPIVFKNNVDIAQTNAYWTPERLRDAKPLDLPTVDEQKIRKTDIKKYLNEQTTISTPEGEDGAPPSTDLKPNTKPLFTPLKALNNSPIAPFDRGTRNEHFSSTQLIPLTADLSYPYRAVGKLFFTIPGQGNFVCSASVIKPRVVLTAGHCVHSGSGGSSGFFTNWLFIPAFRDGIAPFQSWTWSYVNTTNSWSTGGGDVPNAGDYAMLEFNDKVINGSLQKIGNVAGILGFQLQSLIPNHVNLLGYPCNFDSCQKMHQVTAESAVSVAPNNVEYGSDMGGGSSGGPWIQNFGKFSVGQTGGLNPGLNRVVGVTSWGYNNSALKGQGASNFNAEFTTLLNNLCAHRAGNC